MKHGGREKKPGVHRQSPFRGDFPIISKERTRGTLSSDVISDPVYDGQDEAIRGKYKCGQLVMGVAGATVPEAGDNISMYLSFALFGQRIDLGTFRWR